MLLISTFILFLALSSAGVWYYSPAPFSVPPFPIRIRPETRCIQQRPVAAGGPWCIRISQRCGEYSPGTSGFSGDRAGWWQFPETRSWVGGKKKKTVQCGWRPLSFKQRGKTKGELRVLTLVALTYLHVCSQHVNCTMYRDPPGCLVQDLWRGEILWGWPTCPTKCERDSPKGSGIPAEGFLELSREKRK